MLDVLSMYVRFRQRTIQIKVKRLTPTSNWTLTFSLKLFEPKKLWTELENKVFYRSKTKLHLGSQF